MAIHGVPTDTTMVRRVLMGLAIFWVAAPVVLVGLLVATDLQDKVEMDMMDLEMDPLVALPVEAGLQADLQVDLQAGLLVDPLVDPRMRALKTAPVLPGAINLIF